MQMRRLAATIACLLGATAIAPASADDEGWYVRGTVGYNALSDEPVRHDAGEFVGEASFDGGFAGGGSLGYDFGSWRVEGEVMYRSVDLDTLEGSPAIVTGGDYASLGFAANVIYDFNLFGDERATTYVGAGLVFVEEIDIDFDTGVESSFSGDDTGFQLFVGAEYRFAERWKGFAEVRLMDLGDPDLDAEENALGRVNVDYGNRALLFGVRYDF